VKKEDQQNIAKDYENIWKVGMKRLRKSSKISPAKNMLFSSPLWQLECFIKIKHF
jgi:hypothetical protein